MSYSLPNEVANSANARQGVVGNANMENILDVANDLNKFQGIDAQLVKASIGGNRGLGILANNLQYRAITHVSRTTTAPLVW